MAAQKSLTARERQSREASREKANRKRKQQLWRRVRIGSAAALALSLLGGGFWFWHSGTLHETIETTSRGFWQKTADAGFKVQNIYLEGRKRTPLEDVNKALAVARNAPILSLSLADLKTKLESLSHVKQAAVERSLPGMLHIRIIEREPVAIWQNEGKLSLIDEEGAIMRNEDASAYSNLPMVIGQGAPAQVKNLLSIIEAEPELKPRMKAAVWIGGRRWNIRFHEGVEVRLPEQDATEAWKMLANLDREQKILERDIRAIDLRAKDRVFIKLSPDVIAPPEKKPAKET